VGDARWREERVLDCNERTDVLETGVRSREETETCMKEDIGSESRREKSSMSYETDLCEIAQQEGMRKIWLNEDQRLAHSIWSRDEKARRGSVRGP